MLRQTAAKAFALVLCLMMIFGLSHPTKADDTFFQKMHTGQGLFVSQRKKEQKPQTALVSKVLNKLSLGKFIQRGIASYYGVGDGFQGARTSSGRRFNTYAAMCAHRYLPFGTTIRIVNLKNGLSTTCQIWDRGPFNSRILDMSWAVKQLLKAGGTVSVAIYRV